MLFEEFIAQKGRRGSGEVVLMCRKCNRDKYHTYEGRNVAPVCITCMRELPPVPPGMRRCIACLGIHDLINRNYCAECRKVRKKTPYDYSKAREAQLRCTYGITSEEYNLLFFRQGGLCAICGKPETATDRQTMKPRALCVDHNHETKQVRELLCLSCNHLIGWIERDRERVKKAMKYLKKHDQ